MSDQFENRPAPVTGVEYPPVAAAPTPEQLEFAAQSHKRSVKQARDRAQYTRQQKGHSLILHLTLGAVVLWIPAIYYSVSPNHFWHA
jgi:hypothetical protein